MTNKSGIIIIDVQLGMFDESNPVHQGDILLKKISNLIVKARSVEMPIIYIQHNARAGKLLDPGKPGWAIHPLIKPEANDIVIQKATPDSFLKQHCKKPLIQMELMNY